ncbi:MAG: DNA polymerase IV [Myxococcota bacterium]
MTEPVRRILHLDMDAFYASVEQRDAPALRGRPLAVGGPPERRGVVAAASYEARRYGVRSAMPMSRAVRLCPALVIVPPDFVRYKAVSNELRQILVDATDLVEPLSLDEAYLDVTENKLGLASGTAVAQHLRARVRETLGLTCSVGVAPLKFVAKIASDWNKPDGLTVIRPRDVLRFIHPLPVRRLWGVGPATEKRLAGLSIHTIGQLAAMGEAVAQASFGSHGVFLWQLSQGIDPRPVRPHRIRKSWSAEQTFAEDIIDLDILDAILADQAERIAHGLVHADTVGRTIRIKVRYADFTTVTRAATLSQPTADPGRIAVEASALLRRTDAGRLAVRLIGVGIAGLEPDTEQAQLSLPFRGPGMSTP